MSSSVSYSFDNHHSFGLLATHATQNPMQARDIESGMWIRGSGINLIWIEPTPLQSVYQLVRPRISNWPNANAEPVACANNGAKTSHPDLSPRRNLITLSEQCLDQVDKPTLHIV